MFTLYHIIVNKRNEIACLVWLQKVCRIQSSWVVLKGRDSCLQKFISNKHNVISDTTTYILEVGKKCFQECGSDSEKKKREKTVCFLHVFPTGFYEASFLFFFPNSTRWEFHGLSLSIHYCWKCIIFHHLTAPEQENKKMKEKEPWKEVNALLLSSDFSVFILTETYDQLLYTVVFLLN